jgi:hypothetical protein
MNNIGSITKIYYVFKDDVLSISDPDEDNIVEIQLKKTKKLKEFDFTVFTASFFEPEKNHSAGNYSDQGVKCKRPKINTENNVDLDSLNNRELLLIIIDGNINLNLVGSLDSPVLMKKSLIRPGDPSGYNGYDIEFTSKSPQPAYFILKVNDENILDRSEAIIEGGISVPE